MHVGVGLASLFTLFFFFFFSSKNNEDRMMESKDQARFQVQLHPIISYLPSLIPSPVVWFQSLPQSLVLTKQNCACEIECCPHVRRYPQICIHIAREPSKIVGVQEINSYKWVQVDELCSPLMMLPRREQCIWSLGDFNSGTVARPP